jgi:two-component system, OmpR family, phosphate regulon sensor histidine kinase PhoR
MATIFIIVLLIALAGLVSYTTMLHLHLREQKTDYNVQVVRSARHIAELEQQVKTLRQQLSDQDDREALKAEFSRKRALMLTLANVSYDAAIVVNPECEIIAINDSGEKLFPAETYLGRKLIDVTQVQELSMMVNDALINEEEEFEEQLTIDDANYRVRAKVYRRDDVHMIALAIHDITTLVRLNRARRDMVANIGHELRTPIANIRLHIDGLFHDQDKPKRKDSIYTLRAIAKETENLLWLVQEMSDLSMIESGQSIVRLIDHSLTEVVDDALERMGDRAENAKIQLVRHIPEKLRVLCDRDLIQRVFVNLIHNAIKWSPKDEAVTISASNGGDEVMISVLDNGPGVPPDAVDRIFERFYQVDSSRSGREGSGLGLAICRHIVEAHGGRIWAESNADGAGGRFLFTLLSAGHEEDEDSVAEEKAIDK